MKNLITKKQFVSLLCVFLLGCTVLLTAYTSKQYRTKVVWDGTPYNSKNINSVDVNFIQPYNKTLDDAGDFFIFLTIFATFVSLFAAIITAENKKNALMLTAYDVIIFGDCWLYALGVYNILKTLAGRIRPYMYFPNPSQKGVEEGDFFRSWPSGHSTLVFMSFGYIFAWYAKRNPDSKFRKPMLILTGVLACATMVLRMLSGNHFLTDVLSGAALGFIIGFSIFNVCNSIYGKQYNNFYGGNK